MQVQRRGTVICLQELIEVANAVMNSEDFSGKVANETNPFVVPQSVDIPVEQIS